MDLDKTILLDKIKQYENKTRIALENYSKKLASPGYRHFLMSLINNIDEHLNEMDGNVKKLDIPCKCNSIEIEKALDECAISEDDFSDDFWYTIIKIEEKKIKLYGIMSNNVNDQMKYFFIAFTDDEKKLKDLAEDRKDLENL